LQTLRICRIRESRSGGEQAATDATIANRKIARNVGISYAVWSPMGGMDNMSRNVRVETSTRRVGAPRGVVAAGRDQHEAGTAHAANDRRFTRPVDLAAQLADMDIDPIRPRRKPTSPNVFKKNVTRHDVVGMLHQIFQQPKLARQQLDFATLPLNLTLDEIERQRSYPQHRGARLPIFREFGW
jgi:hypothetical protein